MTPVEASDRRKTFCTQLKSERERRGTSIATIAESTKVKASLLDALERGDLSRWPKGIYRRAFFRDYVVAIGLSPDALVNDFLDVFSDGGPTAPVQSVPPATPASFRLLFEDKTPIATTPAGAARSRPSRLLTAAVDLLAIAAVAGLVAAFTQLSFSTTGLALAAVGAVATAWLGLGPTEWLYHSYWHKASAATFAPSSLPYNIHAPSAAHPAVRAHLGNILSASRLRDYVERLSEWRHLTFNRRRHEELSSVRSQRAEAARRAADELFT